MFRSRFSKFCALLLVFGIIFSACSVSYAETPLTGKPNSTLKMYNEDGSVKRRRQFDEKGRVKKDIDYNHPGKNHEFPHVHDWKWEEGKAKRDNPREPKEGEIEEVEKITVGVALGTILYYVISEGSRIVFPPRNLIPVP